MLPLLPPAVVVVSDDGEPPNPWRGYQLCLSGIPEEGHVAVLQDDTVPCRNFAPALELIAAANPNVPVTLFLSKLAKVKRTYNLALLRQGRSRYATVHTQDLVHVVAILWPVQKAREFMEWIEENPKRIRGDQLTTSDDACVSRWLKLTQQEFRCTIPSIVQHPDDVPSLVNTEKMSNGKDTGRTAAMWIGDGDPLELDWSR